MTLFAVHRSDAHALVVEAAQPLQHAAVVHRRRTDGARDPSAGLPTRDSPHFDQPRQRYLDVRDASIVETENQVLTAGRVVENLFEQSTDPLRLLARFRVTTRHPYPAEADITSVPPSCATPGDRRRPGLFRIFSHLEERGLRL